MHTKPAFDTGFDEGLAQGHDNVIRLADFIQDVLADERQNCSDWEYNIAVQVIDRISAILDSYMDEYREDWNV